MIHQRKIYILFILFMLFVTATNEVFACLDPSDADFNVNNAAPVVDETVVFTDKSNPNDYTITAWNWNFGSDAVPPNASGAGPHSVSYNAIGQKTVTLTITYGFNNQDTEEKVNFINVQDENSNTTPGTTSITIPDCATGVIVEAWGAGGGGTLANPDYGAGGGGGGAYTKGTISGLTPGNTITVTVGAGGASGENGGNSSVTYGSNTITANGGSSSTNSTNGGLGGAAQTIGGIISASWAGGNGGNGRTNGNRSGGGGGGSAFTTTDGNDGSDGSANGTGGAGGDGTGDGGTGGDSDNNPAPQNGYLPGGGGGGRGQWNGIVSASGANGQVSLQWIYSTVEPTVSIEITSGENPSCSGSSVTFTATPTNGGPTPTYQWYEGFDPITNATNSIYTSTTLTTGNTITCVMTSSLNCVTQSNATSNSITMTVNPVPSTPVAGYTSPICTGNDLQLTASNTGTTYSWTGPNGFTSTEQNPVITSATDAMSGIYNVTATTNGCTSEPGSVEVTINSISATVSRLSVNNECPDIDKDQGFNAESGSYDAGSTLVSFRVSVDQTPVSDWSFTYALSGATLRTGLASPPVTPYYTNTTDNITVPSGTSSIDLHFYVNNNPPVEVVPEITITNISNATCTDTGSGPHTANVTINAMPDVGDYE